ncbi:MAG: sensor domain-containing diguanylate cyclase [Candidatus Omnitrophota bacterium]|nr:sensor domain-containing diguanylate cyclase [Candidatus Omnitrophota bacterium]
MSLGAAIAGSAFLIYSIFNQLSFLETTVVPEVYLRRTALALGAFFFCLLGGWRGARLGGGAVFSGVASVMVLFVSVISGSAVTGWFLVQYAAFCFFLYRMDQYYENQIAAHQVDSEKYHNEKNDLENSYKLKGEAISIFFEKYSTYYNLRKLAEELATTLSVTELSKMVVQKTSDFIPRGDSGIISLVDKSGEKLSILASKQIKPRARISAKEGDVFDLWAVRNRKRLIVSDSHQDFRFDLKETMRNESVRSLILAPLLHEGEVIGTLRMNSRDAGSFSNDDLRLLDAIGALAYSAVSNAMLYEKTEELAIRDSLTGMFLRRYFFDRLKGEHRRALLTGRPLSVLMCDIDLFKECNDRFGHGVGDMMLVRFAKILSEGFETGVVARYGGEEFSVLLPETSKEEAAKMAERLRDRVENNDFSIRRERIRMTVSVGVANFPDDSLDMQSLVQKSDEALYQAKRTGRNRVCLSGA